jgi:hypothetical protein
MGLARSESETRRTGQKVPVNPQQLHYPPLLQASQASSNVPYSGSNVPNISNGP